MSVQGTHFDRQPHTHGRNDLESSCYLRFFFYLHICYGPVGTTKAIETLRGLRAPVNALFFILYTGKSTKFYILWRKLQACFPKLFRDAAVYTLSNQQVEGSIHSISYIFLQFIPIILPKHKSFEYFKPNERPQL